MKFYKDPNDLIAVVAVEYVLFVCVCMCNLILLFGRLGSILVGKFRKHLIFWFRFLLSLKVIK